jgi:hypothetical protein
MNRALETGKEFPKNDCRNVIRVFFGFMGRRDEFVYYIESDDAVSLGYDEEEALNS